MLAALLLSTAAMFGAVMFGAAVAHANPVTGDACDHAHLNDVSTDAVSGTHLRCVLVPGDGWFWVPDMGPQEGSSPDYGANNF